MLNNTPTRLKLGLLFLIATVEAQVPPPAPADAAPPSVCRDSSDGFIFHGVRRSCDEWVDMCNYNDVVGLQAACPETCDKCGDAKPPRGTICRVDEYTKRTSYKSDKVFSTISGSSTVLECAKECAEAPTCSSFNYNKAGLQTCELASEPDVATAGWSDWDNYQMPGVCYGDCPAAEVSRFVNAGGARDKSGKFPGNLIMTIQEVSKNKCAKKCEANPDCYAFNHRTAEDTEMYPYKCELLRVPDLYNFSYHELADITVGWRYFRMTSSCASVKAANQLASGTAGAKIIVPIVLGVLLILAVLVVGYVCSFRNHHSLNKKSSKTHPAVNEVIDVPTIVTEDGANV